MAPRNAGLLPYRHVKFGSNVRWEGNENLGTSVKVLTWQHANHGVGFAVQIEDRPDCLGPPAGVRVTLPNARRAA